MSIVRIGLSETEKFGSGWDAIFAGKKKAKATKARASVKKKAKKARKR